MPKEQILLHACCATCAGYALEKLAKDFSPILYFYNPNIHPEEEYLLRLKELRDYAQTQNIPFFEEVYDPENWHLEIKGLEKEPEKGLRCNRCFKLRLQKTATWARENNIPFFTTTLTISPHKNSKAIIEIGTEIGKDYKVEFLPENFKKQDGFQKTMAIAKRMNFYRQNYCGCIYSVRGKS